MLYDNITHQQVIIPKGKEMSDHMKKSVTEKLEPLPHKGNKMFRLEERARVIGL